MNILSRTAFALVVLLSMFVPTMMCAAPGTQMTGEEHACCKQMRGNCGTMRMPASHSCCQVRAESDNQILAQPQIASAHESPVTVVIAFQPFTIRLSSAKYIPFAKAEHSPPRLSRLPSLLRV
jgi:hypothetical protein